MKRLLVFMVVMAFALVTASVALARGAPNKKAFSPVAVAQTVTPTVANVAPVVTGTIEYMKTEPRDLFIAQDNYSTVTTDQRGQSTTGDERGLTSVRAGGFGRSAPRLVLLA